MDSLRKFGGMTVSPDIVGIGVCTVDYLVVVPRMPRNNENMKATRYLRQSGGLASSALVAAARLGARTKIIARIGSDDDGEFIRRELDDEGVDTAQLLAEAGTGSHVSVILVNEQTGDRSIVTRPATGSPIRPQDLSREDIIGAKVLFVDDVSPAALQAAAWARAAGMWVVMDPACPYAVAKEILPYVDVPIVPEQWARDWMPNQPDEMVVETLYKAGARIAVVTLGERGCLVCSDEGLQAYPSYPVEVVDTTGAGDAYHGAFMYVLLQDWDLRRRVQFAAAVGSMNCRALGGRTALPTRAEVDGFLAQHG